MKRDDSTQEVHAVRNGVGMADLSDRGKIRVTGSERVEWFHGMTSNEVKALRIGEGNFGTILTDRGKMVADYHVLVREEDLLFDVEPGTVASVLSHLNRYLISEDAAVHDETERLSLLGLFGPESATTVETVFDIDVSALPLHHWTAASFGSGTVLIARQNRTGERGYDLWVTPQDSKALWAVLAEAGAKPVSAAALETLRIEAGIPRYGADTNENIIPLEARLDSAISYEKGCYVGQEIIARMTYRGHPNKLLVGFQFETPEVPAPATDLFPDETAEKRVGWVTSATYSPTLDAAIGLGYVRARIAKPGTHLVLRGDGGVSKVEIVETPFVRSERGG